jgi:hypothetical protein
MGLMFACTSLLGALTAVTGWFIPSIRRLETA